MRNDNYPVIPAERQEDILGLEHLDHPDGPQLSLFLAGNQYMVVPELLLTFASQHKGLERVYCETLPPRMEFRQILAGGARFRDRLLPGAPDVYTCVAKESVDELIERGLVEPGGCHVYLRNRIVLMVRAGNPLGIQNLEDIADERVRVSQPDPDHEDIARHILRMYHEAGGEELVEWIMNSKREAGATLMTVVHHRETPRRILDGVADVGPVWATEVAHAKAQGLPVDAVELGERLDQRQHVQYYACRMKNAPHPELADEFAFFLRQAGPQKLFVKHGFVAIWS